METATDKRLKVIVKALENWLEKLRAIAEDELEQYNSALRENPLTERTTELLNISSDLNSSVEDLDQSICYLKNVINRQDNE